MSAAPQIDAPLTLGAQLDARARHPELANRIAICHGDRSWTYLDFRNEAVRFAHFLIGRLGSSSDARPGHVAMMLENHPELLALYAGCGYAGYTLFGVNTGLRGKTLAGVLDRSGARVLVVEERFLTEVARILPDLKSIAPENVVVFRPHASAGEDVVGGFVGVSDLMRSLDAEVGEVGVSLDTPGVDVAPQDNLMVIYTSGTTGLPKGINNNHLKLLLIGMRVSALMELTPDDVGYACMPLFHSNAIFLGLHPALHVGGAIALRERFSASAFTPDVLRHGVTFWNYVGEPVHYILTAIEQQYEGDEDRILAKIARNPANRLRYTLGNGAAPPDIDRFARWFGLEDMFELYGSTEAAISTFRKKGDPRGSVGEVTDDCVKILNDRSEECLPARLGADGKIENYTEAVGEICRVAPDTALFQGYFGNPEADSSKYRDGVYHSGDLGHMLHLDGTRFLFFDGRTDDWIRKDGENFSAAQVARIVLEYEDVTLTAAYGVPCSVSDELVMVALKLRDGISFDPDAFFAFCEHMATQGGMDRKWFPDFIRIVDGFDFTQTQKILVRNLKNVHFDRRRLPEDLLFWRTRGDETFRPFTAGDYESLRREFEERERIALLDQ